VVADPEAILTPWSRVLLEKLTGLQPVKKFPAFYGTRKIRLQNRFTCIYYDQFRVHSFSVMGRTL